MKKGETIYCINESVYEDHITKRKSYIIQEEKTDNIRIKNNRQKLVWIPKYCFSTSKIPDLIHINIDDEINDSLNDCIEVTVEFSDGEKRYTTFMTLNWLKKLFGVHREYILGNRLILVEKVDESSIKKAILELDRKDDLYETSIKY